MLIYLKSIGIHAVYILIDEIDEVSRTATDLSEVAQLLNPLLADLNVMNSIPYVAFKIFVPKEIEYLLLYRKDRIKTEEIYLDENNLQEILLKAVGIL